MDFFQINWDAKDEEMINETKLLGLIITSDLRWDRNVDYLVKDANKRMMMLHAASKFTNDKY